ncbi:transposase [Desulfosoma caldarium]|uniref:DDE family transposase n=1 Tax=Desulfosoma caldarium TaxID=610254 RepID=A0A3N1UNC4_9BACT|nr:transposase [Desulfosoma caldarium]ROQ90889.1 DDE family transposase [Desulfosoma caldarium]
MDGTSRHLVDFDALAKDAGYAAAMECEPGRMLSSHAVKRFFCSFWWPRIDLYRHLLQRLFLWRLKLQEPDLIVLGMDTMVMDNDEARVHGVKPTSKRVKGFQPLQMTRQNHIIDAVFRRGDAHSNNGKRVERMVRHVVARIRKPNRADVAIIVRMDSELFDQKLFEAFENLLIGDICGCKLYEPIKEFVAQSQRNQAAWGRYKQGSQVWQYLELGTRCGRWESFRRALFCRPLYQDAQMVRSFPRPDTVVVTNLGMGRAVDTALTTAGYGQWLQGQGIIAGDHGRGSMESGHRGIIETDGTMHVAMANGLDLVMHFPDDDGSNGDTQVRIACPAASLQSVPDGFAFLRTRVEVSLPVLASHRSVVHAFRRFSFRDKSAGRLASRPKQGLFNVKYLTESRCCFHPWIQP